MVPNFLLPETVVRENGNSPELELGNSQGKALNLTLGITRIVEQESIDVSVWGSADAKDWGTKPLVAFPQKFYCGTYKMLLDLTEHPDVKYVRVQWKMNRWGRGDAKPLFGIYVFGQDASTLAEAGKAGRS